MLGNLREKCSVLRHGSQARGTLKLEPTSGGDWMFGRCTYGGVEQGYFEWFQFNTLDQNTGRNTRRVSTYDSSLMDLATRSQISHIKVLQYLSLLDERDQVTVKITHLCQPGCPKVGKDIQSYGLD